MRKPSAHGSGSGQSGLRLSVFASPTSKSAVGVGSFVPPVRLANLSKIERSGAPGGVRQGRAIQIFNLNKETYFKALSFHNMGMAYAKLNSLDSAVIYLNLSFEIHNANSDTIELGRHYIEVAKVASAENQQFEKAKHFAQTSLKFRKQKLPAWHSDVIESQLALGNIYVQEPKQNANQQKEMNNLAMALFDDALIAALKSPRSERALEPLSNKAILCSNQGKQDLQLA